MVASGSPVTVKVAQPTMAGLGCCSCDSQGRQVDGDAAIVAEALEGSGTPFPLWVSLPSTPMPGLVWLVMAASDDEVGMLPDFPGAEKRRPACSDHRVWSSCPGIPSTSVAPSRRQLCVVGTFGVVQRQELILDALSKSPIDSP